MRVRNLKYNVGGTIDCEYEHPVYGWIQFTASPDDAEDLGRSLYTAAISGEFGEVAPYVAPVLSAEQVAAIERKWRDGQIGKTDYLAMPDYPLTEAQRTELYAHRKALRDWPESAEFPSSESRPQPPQWLAASL